MEVIPSVVMMRYDDLNEAIREAALRGAEIALKRAPKDRPSQYLLKDAAKELGISPPTLTKRIRAGEVRLNQNNRVSASEIDRLLAGGG